MKKLILIAGLSVCGFFATAQRLTDNLTAPKGRIADNTAIKNASAFINHKTMDKVTTTVTTKSMWWNYFDSAKTYQHITFTGYNNSTLFFDSTVKQVYGKTGGGTQLGYVGLHSMGQVFDPSYTYFNDDTITKNFPYTVDSIAFAYAYNYVVPGSVDTLFVQYYVERNKDSMPNGGLLRATFTNSGTATAYTLMDSTTQLGFLPLRTDTILLGQKDTTTRGLFMSLKAGYRVFTGGITAFTVTYKAGYKYSLGDTIDQKWTTPITKKLNHFRVIVANDLKKTAPLDNSVNLGLELGTAEKYSTANAGGWKSTYVPGNAWNGFNENLQSIFHITSTTITYFNGIDEASKKNGYALGDLYPNPVTGSVSNLEFATGKAGNVSIDIYNLVGQKIMTVANGTFTSGNHKLSVNTEGMKSGMYLYTITANGFTQTKKFTVAN